MQAKFQAQFPTDKKRAQLLKTERELLLLSAIPPEFLETGDMAVSDSEFIHYSTVSKTPANITQKSSNVLLIIHGFGGCGAMNYRLVERLSGDFFLVLIDLPGFGFSSRPKKSFECIDSCISFFVGRIGVFMESLGLGFFSVVGHSLGAFIAAHFFQAFPEKVDRLILLSPAGMNFPLEDQDAHFRKFHKNRSRLAKFLIQRFARKIFEQKRSPFEMLFWPFKGALINFYLKSKRFDFSERERELMGELARYFIDLPQCGERSIGFVLHYGPMSRRPIIEVLYFLKERASAVSIIWGDRDFMDKDRSVERLGELGLSEVRIAIARNADHQLPFQAAEAVRTEVLLAFLEGEKGTGIEAKGGDLIKSFA